MPRTRFGAVMVGLAAVLCLGAWTGWASAGEPAEADAIAEAQKAFDAGDYRGAQRVISRALSLSAPEPTADQRYQLLMLRGECLLRLGERVYAHDAFDAATNATTDIPKAAAARATAVLITLSRGPQYKPAGASEEPIPIVPPQSRKKAMRGALKDLLDRDMAAIRKALEGDTLPPMLELVPRLGDMFVLELTSAGEARQTSQVLRAFGEHARSLMGKELRRIRGRVASLGQLADSPVDVDHRWGWGSGLERRGLWTPERDELQELIEYTVRIRDAAVRGRRIARSFGFTGENWDPVLAEATEVLDGARELWERRF